MREWLSQIRTIFAAQTRTQRELVLAALALLCGVTLVPTLIWLLGHATLGEYVNGGPLALQRDFLVGLVRGAPAFWAAAFGPYVALLLLRLAWFLSRR